MIRESMGRWIKEAERARSLLSERATEWPEGTFIRARLELGAAIEDLKAAVVTAMLETIEKVGRWGDLNRQDGMDDMDK